MKRKPVAAMLLLLFTPFGSLPAQPSGSSYFTWSFIYKNRAEIIKSIDFNDQSISLSQSDKMKIFLEYDAGVYVYLFLHDAEENLYLLYPRSFNDFDGEKTQSISVFIPEGLQWFEFTEGSGTERFYLICSMERLRSLEDYMKSYVRQSAGQKKDVKTSSDSRQKVLEEMRRLQLDHYEIVKKAKEDVILAAGEFRGLEESFEFPAQRIQFADFYSRTIRISH